MRASCAADCGIEVVISKLFARRSGWLQRLVRCVLRKSAVCLNRLGWSVEQLCNPQCIGLNVYDVENHRALELQEISVFSCEAAVNIIAPGIPTPAHDWLSVIACPELKSVIGLKIVAKDRGRIVWIVPSADEHPVRRETVIAFEGVNSSAHARQTRYNAGCNKPLLRRTPCM